MTVSSYATGCLRVSLGSDLDFESLLLGVQGECNRNHKIGTPSTFVVRMCHMPFDT